MAAYFALERSFGRKWSLSTAQIVAYVAMLANKRAIEMLDKFGFGNAGRSEKSNDSSVLRVGNLAAAIRARFPFS